MSNGGLTAIITASIIAAVGLLVFVVLALHRRRLRKWSHSSLEAPEAQEAPASRLFKSRGRAKSLSPSMISSKPLLTPNDSVYGRSLSLDGSTKEEVVQGSEVFRLSDPPIEQFGPSMALRPNRLEDSSTDDFHAFSPRHTIRSRSLNSSRDADDSRFGHRHPGLFARFAPAVLKVPHSEAEDAEGNAGPADSRFALGTPAMSSPRVPQLEQRPADVSTSQLIQSSLDLPARYAPPSQLSASVTVAIPPSFLIIHTRETIDPRTSERPDCEMDPNRSDDTLASHFSSPSLTPTTPTAELTWTPNLLGRSSPWRGILRVVRSSTIDLRGGPESPMVVVQDHSAFHRTPQVSEVTHQDGSQFGLPRPLPVFSSPSQVFSV